MSSRVHSTLRCFKCTFVLDKIDAYRFFVYSAWNFISICKFRLNSSEIFFGCTVWYLLKSVDEAFWFEFNTERPICHFDREVGSKVQRVPLRQGQITSLMFVLLTVHCLATQRKKNRQIDLDYKQPLFTPEQNGLVLILTSQSDSHSELSAPCACSLGSCCTKCHTLFLDDVSFYSSFSRYHVAISAELMAGFA